MKNLFKNKISKILSVLGTILFFVLIIFLNNYLNPLGPKEKIISKYDDGEPKQIDRLTSNNRLLKRTWYYENGQVSDEEIYDDYEHIEKSFGFYENGDTSIIMYVEKGIGLISSYHENGIIRSEGKISFYKTDKGEKEGKWTFYHDNEKIKQIWYYENGLENGQYLEYSSLGELSILGNYKDGEPDGEMIFYDKEGNIMFKDIYDNGKLIETIDN